MKRNLSTLLPVVAVLVAAIIPWNHARAKRHRLTLRSRTSSRRITR